MIVIDCAQNTPEWHAARCGRVTASRIADIMRKTKTGHSKMRATYAGELVAERLAGVQEEGFASNPMQWGKETEEAGRQTYALLNNVEPVCVGFVVHPTIDKAGCSPDSLVGDDGGLELKCPNSATHIQTLLGAEIDPDYVKQIQWGLACTGRAWWDFGSYDPRFPAEMQLHVRRVHRDPVMIAEMEREVRIFVAEVDELEAELRARFQMEAAA